jgi:hypothetical protein
LQRDFEKRDGGIVKGQIRALRLLFFPFSGFIMNWMLFVLEKTGNLRDGFTWQDEEIIVPPEGFPL